MSITGDTTIYGQPNNITGDNTALYGIVSSDVLNITDAITFQPLSGRQIQGGCCHERGCVRCGTHRGSIRGS